MRARTTVTLATLIVGVSAVMPAIASGDGLPVVVDSSAGVYSADGEVHYTATPENEETIVEREDSTSGEVSSILLDGVYSVPAIAMDATASGLSHDGGTLVLINPRRSFPREETALIVLDAATLEVRDEIVLDGDFSFDALSPDGSIMYLIEYTDRRDPTRYAVRSYDLANLELDSAPVIDKSEPDEQMRGFPLTRVTGTGGVWEYTLYDGGGGEPFVHALDTVNAATLCIDLPWLSPRDVWQADLAMKSEGATIAVNVKRGGFSGPVAAIDTATGEAGPIGPEDAAETEPATEPAPGEPADEASVGGGTLLGLGAAALAILAAAFLSAALMRHRGGTS